MNTHTEAPEALYLAADELRTGDTLPDVSRHAVTGVVIFPHESVRIVFGGGAYVKHLPYGGPDFGWPAVRVERPRTLSPYAGPSA